MSLIYKIMAVLGLVCLSLQVQADIYSTPKNVFTEEHLGITVTADRSEFAIRLKSNPTTGYAWFLREYDSQLLTPINHIFETPKDKKLMGAPGYEVWTFKMKPAAFTVPQQTVMRFVYARPWESVDQSKQLVFRISTLG